MTIEIPQTAATPAGAASALDDGLGCALKAPHELNDIAIYVAGLAEVLQQKLDEAQHRKGVEDAMNISWAYNALGQMANDLAEQISQYAP